MGQDLSFRSCRRLKQNVIWYDLKNVFDVKLQVAFNFSSIYE